MKNVYFAQFGAEFGDGSDNCVFFPYAIGSIAAYAFSKPEIRETYSLKELLFLRRDFSVSSLEDPFLVCFSCYVWNYDYNIECAKLIREAYPSCKILFGGHQILYSEESLKSLPFVDFLSCFEGELSVCELLRELDGGSLANVSSLVYRDGGTVRRNPVRSIPAGELVSPYLSGVFDPLLKKDMEYIATIETTRGCPFACAYCDTALYDGSVKKIPLDRTKKEIDWLSEHKIAMCFCIDSNFGISPHDVEVARYIADKKAETGFPQKLDVALSKEKNKPALKTVEILHNAGLFHIVTLSVQSTNSGTLRAIGRKNLDLDTFHDCIERYRKLGIKPFTELILGLPLETYDSFCRGFDTLIRAGQRYYIEVYRCYILPNTTLSREATLNRYGIKTVWTMPILHHISHNRMRDISKSARIVVATDAMPQADWIRANLFAAVMQACYFMGPLRYVADRVCGGSGGSYSVFFEELIRRLLDSGCATGKILRRFTGIFSAFAEGKTPLHYYSSDFGELTWFVEEGLFLEIAGDPVRFYDDVKNCLGDVIPAGEAEELFRYQELMLFLPEKRSESERFSYDFYAYFSGASGLIKRPNRLTVRQNSYYPSKADYAREIVWYKRKFGGTLCGPENCFISAEYE